MVDYIVLCKRQPIDTAALVKTACKASNWKVLLMWRKKEVALGGRCVIYLSVNPYHSHTCVIVKYSSFILDRRRPGKIRPLAPPCCL